jgi:hypothetical protein
LDRFRCHVQDRDGVVIGFPWAIHTGEGGDTGALTRVSRFGIGGPFFKGIGIDISDTLRI